MGYITSGKNDQMKTSASRDAISKKQPNKVEQHHNTFAPSLGYILCHFSNHALWCFYVSAQNVMFVLFQKCFCMGTALYTVNSCTADIFRCVLLVGM